jgi:acetyl esterase/lipase
MGIVFGRISAETPAHTVLRSTPKYEVRSYPAQVAAVYTEPGGGGAASGGSNFGNNAFRALAGFYGIGSGPQQRDAARREPIAMTAPVFMAYPPDALAGDDAAGGTWAGAMQSMTFLLPAKYASAADAPQPTNERVTLVDVPPRTAAVIVFGGNLSLASIRSNTRALRDALAADGVTVVDPEAPRVAGYNPPFCVPWAKTNEVQFTVEPATLPPSPPPGAAAS